MLEDVPAITTTENLVVDDNQSRRRDLSQEDSLVGPQLKAESKYLKVKGFNIERTGWHGKERIRELVR